jgi:hypothetical protein
MTAPRDQTISSSPHVTPTFPGGAAPDSKEEPSFELSLLTGMLRHRHPAHPRLRVVVGYPNIGRLLPGRLLLVHHGHFTDEIYRVMTTLSRAVYGGETEQVDLEQMEEDNAAWIDFMWSSLGQQGGMAHGLRRSYNLVHSGAGKVLLCTRLAVAFARAKRTRLGRKLRQGLLRPALLRLIDRLQNTDVRHGDPTESRVAPGVADYLGGPVARALARELAPGAGGESSELTFVYGHTHHPLAQRLVLPGRSVPARIYNTGGWVVDGEEPRPAVGGAIVLIDESLDAVLLGLCTQAASPQSTSVWLAHADGPDADSPLLRSLQAFVLRDGGPWRQATMTFAEAILRRRAERLDQLRDELMELSRLERLALRVDHLWSEYDRRHRRSLNEMRRFSLEAPRHLLSD